MEQQRHAERIAEHMEVVGSDGGHVGTVDKVEGDRIKLTKKDDPDGSGAHHHYLPLGAVASVSGGRAQLNLSAEQAKRMAVAGGSAEATDEGMGSKAGITGAGAMEPGQKDMAEDRISSLGGAGGGGTLRDGVPDKGAEAGAAGLSGDAAPGTISGRAGGVGASTGGRSTGGGSDTGG